MAGQLDPVVDGWILEYAADQVIKTVLTDARDSELWAEFLQAFLKHVRATGDRVVPSGQVHVRLLAAKLLTLVQQLQGPNDLAAAVPVFLKLHSGQEMRTQPVLTLLLMLCTQAVLFGAKEDMRDRVFFPLVENGFEPALQACKDLNLSKEWHRVFEDAIKELMTLVHPEHNTVQRDVLQELKAKHSYPIFLRNIMNHLRGKLSQLEQPTLLRLAEEEVAPPTQRGPPPSGAGINMSALRANFRGNEAEWARVIDGRHRDIQQFYGAPQGLLPPMPPRSPARAPVPPMSRRPEYVSEFDGFERERPEEVFYARRSGPLLPPREPLPPPPAEPVRQFEVARQLQASRQHLMSVINDPLEDIERSLHGGRPMQASPRRSVAQQQYAPISLSDDVVDEDEDEIEDDDHAESAAMGARRKRGGTTAAERRVTEPLRMKSARRAVVSSDEEGEAEEEEEEEEAPLTKRPKLRDPDTSRVAPLRSPGPAREKGVKRGQRNRFQQWEVSNLIEGVNKYGRNWEQIRAHYEFQGRTAVDLKDKYRNLQKFGGIDGKSDSK